ncbi:hypothetical protein BC2230_100033 [Burkholderia cepacia]
MRSRSGTSRRSARCSTISRLGCARPDSTKLRWRAETSASSASAIWLRRRRCRHVRSSGPMPDARPADGEGEWRAAVGFMQQMIGNPACLGHYLRRKHRASPGVSRRCVTIAPVPTERRRRTRD